MCAGHSQHSSSTAPRASHVWRPTVYFPLFLPSFPRTPTMTPRFFFGSDNLTLINLEVFIIVQLLATFDLRGLLILPRL
jgi:hypothetical protein